ncbi:MAG: DUF6529 family protein [Pseudonocardia sp.]
MTGSFDAYDPNRPTARIELPRQGLQPPPPPQAQQPPPPPGSEPAPEPAQKKDSGGRGTFLAIAIGLSVTVVLGVYGRVHEPQHFGFSVAGFSNGVSAKAWLASIAFLFALVQLVSALIMYGKLPIKSPSWIGTLHRWSGRIAVLVSVPVAVHCLYALGFSSGSPRALVHSIFGTVFYGAFVAKMIVLQRPKSPWWALPVLGGTVFTGLTVLWLTASLWYFTTKGFVV